LNDAIIIRGARTHNLKNISCEIPHGKLTVVSGVSGSGKSSLAFDTIYADGQRRYVESLSAYARQFLERIEKPDVDEIDGLAPAIAIKQKNTTRNPRSTVATATEIYDYLRLLYARCGTVHCIHCDGLVKRDSVDEAAETTLALGEGTRLNVLFPVITASIEAGAEGSAAAKTPKTSGRKAKAGAKTKLAAQASDSPHLETLKARLAELRGGGFNRLWQQGKIFEFSTPESLLDLDFTLPVFVLLDRVAVSAENRPRIVDAI
jgi:excinuclease ABC subunit A